MSDNQGNSRNDNKRWGYGFRKLRYDYALLLSRSESGIQRINLVIGALSALCAVACVIVLILYLGYNLSYNEAKALRVIIHFTQVVFCINILYKFLFVPDSDERYRKVFMWIVDGAVILTFMLWLRPLPSNGVEPMWMQAIHSYKLMFAALGSYSIVEICYTVSRIPGRRTNPSLLLALSFVIFIVIGSFVLLLPRCTYHGISYVDSLFVASSAVCITGLTSVDIPATFTPFGILVLSVLVQLGSLGIITFTSFFALFFAGNSSIYNQLLLRDVIYSKSMNALVPTLLYVLGFTLTIEIIGAVFVYLTLPADLGLSLHDRLMVAAFHSMSSFCNAGFSYIPSGMANPVLLHGNQLIYVVTSVLIFAGGIGFPLLVNFTEILKSYIKKALSKARLIKEFRMPLHVFDLNTKIVLVTTLSVLIISSVLFFIFENGNTLKGMPVHVKVVQSVFNSLIPRSAGFASVNPANFLNVTMLIILVQMIIGGSSQSMAGGIKVNTLGVVILNVRSVLYGHEGTTAFQRTVNRASVRRANAVIAIAALSLITYTITIMLLEPTMSSRAVVFETVSALFTVGSSLGITESLSVGSKIVLATAMFLGRVGIISLLAGMVGSKRDISEHLPVDNIIIN